MAEQTRKLINTGSSHYKCEHARSWTGIPLSNIPHSSNYLSQRPAFLAFKCQWHLLEGLAPAELESRPPESAVSSFGEGGGLGRGVDICGGTFRERWVTGSQVICPYSSFLAALMSSLAPLPKASSMPASFLTRLHSTV